MQEKAVQKRQVELPLQGCTDVTGHPRRLRVQVPCGPTYATCGRLGLRRGGRRRWPPPAPRVDVPGTRQGTCPPPRRGPRRLREGVCPHLESRQRRPLAERAAGGDGGHGGGAARQEGGGGRGRPGKKGWWRRGGGRGGGGGETGSARPKGGVRGSHDLLPALPLPPHSALPARGSPASALCVLERGTYPRGERCNTVSLSLSLSPCLRALVRAPCPSAPAPPGRTRVCLFK